LPITEAAEKLAPLFLKHGYAFFYVFRRGQGLSADQGVFMQDILQREEATKGKEARQHLQFALAATDHLDDVIAALSFLKSRTCNRCQANCNRRPFVWRSTNVART
jgi:carboxymethylenebutenolidase